MNETIKLITVFAEGSQIRQVKREIFAAKKSVKRQEFYAAFAAGQHPQYEFLIQTIEYDASRIKDGTSGEIRYPSKVIYEGEELNIIRAYTIGSEMSLICG